MVYYLGYKEPGSTYPPVKFLEFDFKDARLDTNTRRSNPHLITGVNAFLAGEAIDPGHVPEVLRWASSRSPYDYITLHGSSIVSPRMKELIESFEPGVHQFFPLKVVNEAGEQIAERWLWVVCNNIDSVDREHRNFEFRNNMRWRADKIEHPRLVFNQKQVGVSQFWRDPHLDLGNLQCSDEAGSELINANLVGLVLGLEESI